ncbi:hypothetical protein D3C86_1450450 [compost metagenome]
MGQARPCHVAPRCKRMTGYTRPCGLRAAHDIVFGAQRAERQGGHGGRDCISARLSKHWTAPPYAPDHFRSPVPQEIDSICRSSSASARSPPREAGLNHFAAARLSGVSMLSRHRRSPVEALAMKGAIFASFLVCDHSCASEQHGCGLATGLRHIDA